jgi:hypothetical protein
MSGYTGITGPQGPQGPRGPTGPVGPAGYIGPTGSQGRFQAVQQTFYAPTGTYTGKQFSPVTLTQGIPLLVSGDSISINGKIDSNSYNNYSDPLTLNIDGTFQIPAGNFFIRGQMANPWTSYSNDPAGNFLALSAFNGSNYTDVAYGTLTDNPAGPIVVGASLLHYYVSQSANQTYAIRIYLGQQEADDPGSLNIGGNDWAGIYGGPPMTPPSYVPSVNISIIKLY